MFPHDITPIAKIAIKNSEWHTLDYLLSQLHSWMDSPDKDTAVCALSITTDLIDAVENDKLLTAKYCPEIHALHKYIQDSFNRFGIQ
jgi:hypothetical protein